jgi:riboflavin kinase/FMN adenylyltransferase
VSVETLILDFNRDIYGKEVVLEILEFLRPVLKFAILLEVREQVEEDILEAKKILLDRGLTL